MIMMLPPATSKELFVVKMENAKPGQAVLFHGLQGAAHLNGKRGHLIKFLRDQQRWVVSCDDDDVGETVNVKPANLELAGPKKEYFVHPLTGQVMIPKTTSVPVTDTSIVREGIADLHSAVLSAYHRQRKGGVVVSCGDDYMIAIEFDGPHGNGGVYGEMVFTDKCGSAQAVVRDRGCQRATELGRNFLAGETVQYIDTTHEIDFFNLLSKYKMQARSEGHIDIKSGLKLYSVALAR
ncbi:hypothetical protein ACHAWT_006717 [Skeletonema menzelii]